MQPELRLAIKNRTANMYGISQGVPISAYVGVEAQRSQFSPYMGGAEHAWMDLMHRIVFHIQQVASEIEFIRMHAEFDVKNFAGFDPRPQYAPAQLSSRISDFKFFKTANPGLQDIIVTPELVPELMQMVLKAQKPILDKVRANEQSRRNYEAYNGINVKPAHEVQLQIVTMGAA